MYRERWQQSPFWHCSGEALCMYTHIWLYTLRILRTSAPALSLCSLAPSSRSRSGGKRYEQVERGFLSFSYFLELKSKSVARKVLFDWLHLHWLVWGLISPWWTCCVPPRFHHRVVNYWSPWYLQRKFYSQSIHRNSGHQTVIHIAPIPVWQRSHIA